MNLLNPDAFIAQKNIERYARTGIVDTTYLASLSGDALPYTIHLLKDPRAEVRESFAHEMYLKNTTCYINDCVASTPDTWKSMHIYQQQIQTLLEENRKTIEAGKDYTPTAIPETN